MTKLEEATKIHGWNVTADDLATLEARAEHDWTVGLEFSTIDPRDLIRLVRSVRERDEARAALAAEKLAHRESLAVGNAFIDEINRLTKERDEARALAEKYLGERVPRSDVKRARREGAEAMREAAAQACKAIYRDHKRSKSYPIDMGGLAEECEAAVRALPLPGDEP